LEKALVEVDLVDVAPSPVFPGFDGSHDRVPVCVEVRGGVAVFGGIATTDLPTFQTHAEMNPGVSDLETFLATLGVRLHFLQMIFYVRALDCAHGSLFLVSLRQKGRVAHSSLVLA
jgi:hypothetical protein